MATKSFGNRGEFCSEQMGIEDQIRVSSGQDASFLSHSSGVCACPGFSAEGSRHNGAAATPRTRSRALCF